MEMNSEMPSVIFTLCSNNFLAQAKTLGDSVLRVCPNAHFVIGLVDEWHPEIDYRKFTAFEIIKYNEIGFDFFNEMLTNYNIIEFNTAMKPFYLEYLLEKYGKEAKVYYIDPDIVFYEGLDKLHGILDTHPIVLTPMLTEAGNSVSTDELVALRHGIYNLGFIGIRYSEETLRFLYWWQQRLRKHCIIDKPRGLFVDQKWIDLAPLFFSDIFILSDQGYNMAWWNISERTLLRVKDNYYVNDLSQPLVFFHFSGFKPGNDIYFGRMEYIEHSFETRPDLKDIFKDYSKLLIENEYLKFIQLKPLLKFVESKHSLRTRTGKWIKSGIKSFLKKYCKVLFLKKGLTV